MMSSQNFLSVPRWIRARILLGRSLFLRDYDETPIIDDITALTAAWQVDHSIKTKYKEMIISLSIRKKKESYHCGVQNKQEETSLYLKHYRYKLRLLCLYIAYLYEGNHICMIAYRYIGVPQAFSWLFFSAIHEHTVRTHFCATK